MPSEQSPMMTDFGRNKAMYLLALLLSWVFHPFVIAIPTLWYAIYATTRDSARAWLWTGLTALMIILPAITFILYKLRRHHYTDADVSVREHRFSLAFFVGICTLVFISTLVLFGAPRVLITCFLAGMGALVLGTLAMIQTKVSAHLAVIGGCVAILYQLFPPILLPSLALTFGVAWSRIYLKQHTLPQVAIGWIIAVISVQLSFALYYGPT